jgi:hypothetical protein
VGSRVGVRLRPARHGRWHPGERTKWPALRRRRRGIVPRPRSVRESGDPQMQPNAHHARRIGALLIQAIEAVDAVAGEVVAEDEPASVEIPHVVGVKRVRKNDVRAPRDDDHIRGVVVIRVGVVEESSVLDEEPPGIKRARRARVPADGRPAGRAGDGLDAASDHGPLGGLIHVRLALPPPAVRRHLMTVRHGLCREPRRERQRPATCTHRGRDPVSPQQRADARPACTGAVLEVALHAQIARAIDTLDDLVDELVRFVAHAQRQLRPLLNVHYDRQSQPRLIGPDDSWRGGAITGKVAVIRELFHLSSSSIWRPDDGVRHEVGTVPEVSLPRDTSRKAAAAQRSVFRSMSGPDRLALACQMSDELRGVARDGAAHRDEERRRRGEDRRGEADHASADSRPGR